MYNRNKITVINVENALKSLKENPDETFTIIPPKAKVGAKILPGTDKYFTPKWVVNGKESDGWFSVRGEIPITRSMADPKDLKDPRNKFTNMRLKIEFSQSSSGVFGEFLETLDAVWAARVKDLEFKGYVDLKKRDVSTMRQTHYSEKHETKAGELLEDPAIRIGIKFGNYSVKHPKKTLQGKPYTVFLDYATAYVDDGIIKYREATVADPDTGNQVPITEDNVHLLITEGSIIRRMRLDMSTISQTQYRVSMPIYANTIVIERNEGYGFDESVEDADEEPAANGDDQGIEDILEGL